MSNYTKGAILTLLGVFLSYITIEGIFTPLGCIVCLSGVVIAGIGAVIHNA